ncbi:hypothetical protein DRP05_03370 [Archaeoglobales archaeon]|nr:MAG: hypothetical protein DRP05_03370 [Archaeoglobales archaeon]
MKFEHIVAIIAIFTILIFGYVVLNKYHQEFHVPKAIKANVCNRGNKIHNITITVFDSERKEIFNKTYQIDNHTCISTGGITSTPGNYTFVVQVDNLTVKQQGKVYDSGGK